MIWLGWALWHINHCRLSKAKFSLYIYIYMIWFEWVLWHINNCRLFNTKSTLYIYIEYIGFWFCWVYGKSTSVGYLMLNILYPYILNICDLGLFSLVQFYGISTIVGY